ncbi:hypothetical protein DYB25_002864 [Aphanomyces astaci]|uniref:Uncharacterized protein n=1 Tax=Aphanomyces astaci TaxID=112090 RepID=A0A396ZSJ3_APHAT|nr:hypothetical protein DYB36_009281 [Aphanomyces astaci]RHX98111.1 hypothetical protein DYB25_002864 [Aphanomyces astaci]RHY48556.1 hypothetical protein DYB34_008622 [Aphanomyces astaci]RHY60881.1 hypothetical protein DYB30_009171 [Aphanomyces astaci]RHY70209.1 hypothetical protein DYB38_007810 [Aphanomyces astaci]
MNSCAILNAFARDLVAMTELSAYEEERSAKIARNKAMMESLGIEAKKDTARQKGPWVKKPYSVILDGVPPHTIVTEPLVTGHSCKELSLQVPSDEYVGHALYPVGKLATMMWLCPGYHPRFSLLQSHQVWANAMVIFINVDLNDR